MLLQVMQYASVWFETKLIWEMRFITNNQRFHLINYFNLIVVKNSRAFSFKIPRPWILHLSTEIAAVEIHGEYNIRPWYILSIGFTHLNLLASDYNAEKHRQLHIILAIIVSVFSACVFILVAYMLIFPASYTEVDTRNREPDTSSTEEKTTTVSGTDQEETKVKHRHVTYHWHCSLLYTLQNKISRSEKGENYF